VLALVLVLVLVLVMCLLDLRSFLVQSSTPTAGIKRPLRAGVGYTTASALGLPSSSTTTGASALLRTHRNVTARHRCT
jgi:hypothetical protein